MNINTLKESIRDLIAKGKAQDAINKFLEYTKIYDKDLDIIVREKLADYKSLKKDKNLDIINYEDATIEANKINNSILDLINEVSNTNKNVINLQNKKVEVENIKINLIELDKFIKEINTVGGKYRKCLATQDLILNWAKSIVEVDKQKILEGTELYNKRIQPVINLINNHEGDWVKLIKIFMYMEVYALENKIVV